MEDMQKNNECCGFGPPQRCFMPKYEAEPDLNWEGCPVTFTEEDEEAAEAENEGVDKEDQAFHAKCPPRGCGKNDGWPVDLTRNPQDTAVRLL